MAAALASHRAKGRLAPTSPAASGASESPFPSRGAGRGWNVLGPTGLAPVRGGTRGLGTGMCWDPWPQCWGMLGFTAPALEHAGFHSPSTGMYCVHSSCTGTYWDPWPLLGACWDAQLLYWDMLGCTAPALGHAETHGLYLGLTKVLVAGTGTYWDTCAQPCDMLGPMTRQLRHSGTRALSAGMCWDPHH